MRAPRSSEATSELSFQRTWSNARLKLVGSWATWRTGLIDGLPSAPTREENLGRGIAAAAVLWMLAVAAWGIAGPFGDGHFAASAAMAVGADNLWRHKILYPFHYYVDGAAPAGSFYLHHPLGVYWVEAILLKVLGYHDWVVRLPAIVYSTLTPFFVYRFGRAAWGPLPGALAAVAYVSLPITLGFASFHALEGPVIFGIAMASWGYARFTQSWRNRYLVVSLVGLLWAVNNDWAGYVWGGLLLSWVFARGFLLPPRWVGPVETRALARYWGLMVGVALASLLFFGSLLVESKRIQDLLSMYAARSAGNQLPISLVLKARHVWIHMMFPGLAILLGKLALPVIVARVVAGAARRRVDLELFPIFILLTAGFQYLHFKQGADVHIFWPQYFALYFALAMGALTASLREALVWARTRRPAWQPAARQLVERHTPWIAAGLVALPLLFVLRDGASMIRLSQESGGRFVSTQIKSDIDRTEAVRWWIQRLTPTERVGFHPAITPIHWSLMWTLRPRMIIPGQRVGARGAEPRAYTMDSRYADTGDLQEAARNFHVEAIGNFWFIDRSKPAAPVTGYSFDERDPGPIDWFLRGGTEPVRTVRPDPWVTWEWRTLLGQAAPPVAGTPATLEQLRVAHNIAVTAGQAPEAARWRGQLQGQLNLKTTTKFTDGTELLGARLGTGAEHAITLYFLTGPGGIPARAKFLVRAEVVAPPRLSTLPRDPDVIEVDQPPSVPTDLWRPGQIYSIKLTYRKRPGTERFFGQFVSLRGPGAPAVAGPTPTVEITVL